jgi:dTMP kinase
VTGRSRGLFITFEGPEGAGKTTQIELLAEAIGTAEAVIVREPGGTDLGEAVRQLLLHSAHSIAPTAEMYLFMAARAELIETRIQPALDCGQVVIADRYHDSTLAYQGGGRGLEVSWPSSFPKPDLTFLLEVPVEVGLSRAIAQRPADRMESAGLDFHHRVASAFRHLADSDPERIVRVDATLGAIEVQAEIRRHLDPLLTVRSES